MKKKIILDDVQLKKIYSKYGNKSFGWDSDLKNGIVFYNEKLGVTIIRFAVLEDDNSFQYDTFGIKQRDGNCVSIVVNHKNEICLLKEYRFMPERYFFSCPRGFANYDEETTVNCSLREIEEEIGEYELINSLDLGEIYQDTAFYISPIGVQLIKINLKNESKLTNKQKEEDIEGVSFYSIQHVKKLVKENQITCGFTLAALSKYFVFIDSPV